MNSRKLDASRTSSPTSLSIPNNWWVGAGVASVVERDPPVAVPGDEYEVERLSPLLVEPGTLRDAPKALAYAEAVGEGNVIWRPRRWLRRWEGREIRINLDPPIDLS